MMNDPNLPNIVASYALATAVIAAMAWRILADHRALKQALSRVEKRRAGRDKA